jgi:hypothetical protein
MEDWIDRFADALGQDRIAPKDVGALLKMSRQVAHGVERKYAPLSTYLAGVYVGHRAAAGEAPGDALRRAIDEALALVPEGPS